MAERNVAAILYGATLFFQVVSDASSRSPRVIGFRALEWREFVTPAA